MNEDEAFIRAIVDSPGDDTSRLVYADWLDDKADPRGAYLRAEYAAVGSGDVTKLSELAAGLDAIWVARVSRPPLGVCCDGLAFLDSGPVLSVGEINEAERRIGIEISGSYRAFLLNYNGGLPKPRDAATLKEWEHLKYPDRFSSIISDARQDDGRSLVEHIRRFRAIVPQLMDEDLWGARPGDAHWQADAIPVNEQGPYFQLFYGVRGQYAGLLHLHDWTGEWCRFGWLGQAPTFPQFLQMLTTHGRTFADTYPNLSLQDIQRT